MKIEPLIMGLSRFYFYFLFFFLSKLSLLATLKLRGKRLGKILGERGKRFSRGEISLKGAWKKERRDIEKNKKSNESFFSLTNLSLTHTSHIF